VRVQVQLKKTGTTAQQIDIVALRRSLNGSIQRLRKLQATYTPVAILALAQHQNVPEDEQPENVPLFLPSALTPAQRALESVHYLAILEKTVREAQCATALERLRCQLHAKSRLLMYKALQARHQGATTRARSIVDRNEVKIRLHSEKYQMAWEAMLRLANGDVSALGWERLRKEDIRCMEDAEELARTAEQRQARENRRTQREDELRRQGELPLLTAAEQEERAKRSRENM
jgi:hypothetical protein